MTDLFLSPSCSFGACSGLLGLQLASQNFQRSILLLPGLVRVIVWLLLLPFLCVRTRCVVWLLVLLSWFRRWFAKLALARRTLTGYFQVLFLCIERLLSFMNVENLVLPATEEAETIWIKKFGFRRGTGMIIGAAGSTVYYNLKLRQPTLDLPIIYYDLEFLFQPMLMLGISIGVACNVKVTFEYW